MDKILRFDIETCPEITTEVEWATYSKRQCWEKKSESNPEIDGTFKSYLKKAWLYPEFSRVVCVSFNVWWVVKSIMETDEKELLLKVDEVFVKWKWKIWWFNIYNFDIPFLRKRMVINWLQPPLKLSITDIKPRELGENIVDVMQIWKQTSFACSLDLLSQTLLWDSPKSDWAGDMVASAWKSENYDWIRKYCEWDVDFTIRCYDAIMNPREIPLPVSAIEDKEVTSPFSSDTWDYPTDKVEDAVEKLRENEVTEEQLKAFDEWIEERKAEAKAKAEKKMAEPIEESDLPF